MLALPSPLHRRLRTENGFSLIETLIAMVTGLLITAAAFALLRVSLEQTQRASDYVQANQLGNTAMTSIVDELDSACLKPGFAPVLEKSTPEKLIFRDAFSKEAEIPNSQIQKHAIVWSKEGTSATGTLTDAKSIVTGTSGSEYTYSTPPIETRIGTHIGKNGSEPIFQYYEYGTEATETAEAGVSPLKLMKLEGSELKSTQAPKVAAVQVSFRAFPTDGKEAADRSIELRSQVTFAFSAPIAEPTITDEPCQ
jgi:Tfp pilus assembly protein PilW